MLETATQEPSHTVGAMKWEPRVLDLPPEEENWKDSFKWIELTLDCITNSTVNSCHK